MNQLPARKKGILKRLLDVRFRSNGHLSGPMGLIDFLAFMYFSKLNIDPKRPNQADRDRFILSGYQYPALYCTLAERGFFDNWCLDNIDGVHPSPRPNNSTPGFEISSNSSLGQGLSIANGIGMALRLRGNHTSKVYVVIGDGECNEGQVWEAVMTTLHYNLIQVVTVFNVNDLQLDGPTTNVVKKNLSNVLKSWGFHVVQSNGHDFQNLEEAFLSLSDEKPNAVILRTDKGNGVSFIRACPMRYHACQLSELEYRTALEELS